mmetsp:Transcript_62611/g.143478  ORF Transcript_62611/g.143478 Transcript_62611/m.143478 type:complete len:91 (-) Transcript_62611:82-354(-)
MEECRAAANETADGSGEEEEMTAEELIREFGEGYENLRANVNHYLLQAQRNLPVMQNTVHRINATMVDMERLAGLPLLPFKGLAPPPAGG